MNIKTKIKIKITLKIIIVMIIVLGAMVIYENHKDRRRADYAKENNCVWTIQGSHDICK